MSVELYDICGADDRPFSPYCWRIRESLILLSVAFETRLVGYKEIRELFADTHRTVPVLVDEGREVGGSWTIAEYLSRNHDPEGRLFGGGGGRPLTAFVTNWVDATVLPQVNRMLVVDIHDNLRPHDQAYFRRKEEKRQGRTLEEAQAGRESRLPALQTSLHPARRAVKERDFIGGPNPTYADIALHATFQWVRAVSSFELLRPDDRLHGWLRRMDDWLAASTGWPGVSTDGG